MQDNNSKGLGMNEATRSKLRAAREALGHNKTATMAVGGNPYDGLSDEELLELSDLVCSLASAASAECQAISDELLRRQPPG